MTDRRNHRHRCNRLCGRVQCCRVMLGYSYKAAKLRAQETAKQALSRPYRQRRCLARHQEHDGYAIVQRTPPSVLSRDEARHILANVGPNCLSRFNGLNEGESWLWKTQLTMSIL